MRSRFLVLALAGLIAWPWEVASLGGNRPEPAQSAAKPIGGPSLRQSGRADVMPARLVADLGLEDDGDDLPTVDLTDVPGPDPAAASHPNVGTVEIGTPRRDGRPAVARIPLRC